MPNSTTSLQSIVDDAASLGDVAPALATGGWSDSPALSIANDVMDAMVKGGPNGQPFPWKWNRFNVTPFVTNAWQQDYAVYGVTNLGSMEHCWMVDINQNSLNVKQKKTLEVKRDLEVTYMTLGWPTKICWLPNDQLLYGTWGQTQIASSSGLQNPGPNVVITDPRGQNTSMPTNPITQIQDPNGNYLVLSQYGTCAGSTPTWPTANAAVGTVVTDGTVKWKVIDPKGQGFRIFPLSASNSRVWEIHPVGQLRPVRFANLGQTLEPLPDDFATYFKTGFFAQCFRRHPDAKVRVKFTQEWQMWLKSLDDALKSGAREMDDNGFYPESSIMDTGQMGYAGPAWPFGGSYGW